MLKREIQQLLLENVTHSIHLISGETYIGTCEINEQSDSIQMITGQEKVSFPYWAVKRIKQL
ncbi:hypothetical protein [Paenibacillus donghaensis]|uniref:Uncharacterized protein n=1 Tax=Paenibacillus donghaensis TaxID=414771 RepID=A0A2Z2KLN1_9BACL|nr:hypothetical protein [Paenibacillus donghaensis]ASA20891.1 hypothetical protein B9T62_08905 [Paenibacillus donghaensis]